MQSKKSRNIVWSLAVVTFGYLFIILGTRIANASQGDISAPYFWIKIIGLSLEIAAAITFLLRLIRLIQPENSFIYSFLATASTILGCGGIVYYCLHKINLIGLHDLLPNAFIGLILFADIFIIAPLSRKPA